MLTTTTINSEIEPAPDDLEQELLQLESLIGRARARQVDLLREVDRLQVPLADGARSLKEWIAGRLDVHPTTASDLSFLARTEPLKDTVHDVFMSFDRVAATTRLEAAGADDNTLQRAAGVAVHHVARLTARQTRMSASSEAEAFQRRRIWMQPNLDRTVMTGTLTLSGTDAEVFLTALDQRADELSSFRDAERPGLAQRRADALVSWATDHHYGPDQTSQTDPPTPRRPKAHVFIEATLAAATNGESGATTRTGLKVGPLTLEEILCVGTTQVSVIDQNGLTPIPTGPGPLHPRVRDYIFQRDGGCTADGCTSTYRLEPHHTIERSRGGTNHPDNLTLFCWFHHHVVIHRNGYTIDPHSPPGRRRFIRPETPGSPPDG